MSNIDVLRDEYPGDAAWHQFFSATTHMSANGAVSTDLRKAVSDEQIAAVIDAKLGKRAVTWLSQPIGALDGNAPIKVLGAPYGDRIMRTLLMRMPA